MDVVDETNDVKTSTNTPFLDSTSVEDLIKHAEGLSYVQRGLTVGAEGKEETCWQAMGSGGRGGVLVEGKTIQDAISKLSETPYHLDRELGRKKDMPADPSDEDLLVRAIALGKSEEELLTDANITNIKYIWEERQALPVETSWTVYGGNGKNSYSYYANSLYDAAAKAYAFGTLGIKKIGEDAENFYLAGYLPGLGIKSYAQEHFGYTGLETIVRKTDIKAMLDGQIEKMFQ